ncbi:MAG: PQQ-binding-like beta-propeller repeat protein, partial [Thermoplasmata archaeon]
MNKSIIRFIIMLIPGLLISTCLIPVINNKVSDPVVFYSSDDTTNSIEDDLSIVTTPQGESEELDRETRGARSGGELEWVYYSKEGAVSTPALVDLDNDGYMEVVYVTTGDEVVALNHDGAKRWINENYVIETSTFFKNQLSYTHWPADLFSSITPANIDRDIRPELMFGAYNGLVFLNHDGEPKYSQAKTGRYYFSTPVIVDLEGDYSNIDIDGNTLTQYKDLEVLTGSTDTNGNSYLEVWHATGGDVFDCLIDQNNKSPFVLGITTGDLDGSMEDEEYLPGEEAWMEIVFGTYQKTMCIYEYNGTQYASNHGHNHPIYSENTSFSITSNLSYATPAVGNFSKVINPGNPQQHEIIVGKGGWLGTANNPVTKDAGLFCYDMNGLQYWRTLNGIIIASSPAVGDVQTLDRNEKTKHQSDYEIFAANSHEGEIYCVDADDGTELWSWEIDGAKSTGNRILSSPAICNIDADNELEVVVGSDNGKVYCFDGDPSDANNDGEEFSQYVGEGTAAFDLLWEFNTHDYSDKVDKVGKIGISSPVVADIDKDCTLEVIIGDTVGNVWCISAGGTGGRGQQDWTMFHADLNNSGLYDPRIFYDIDIESARDPVTGLIDSREKWVEPGQMITYNLSIINKGHSHKDDVDIIYITTYIPKSNYTMNSGWYYTLEGDAIQEQDGMKYVKLAMQEDTLIQLKVTAPWEGEVIDYIDIIVKVNSSKNPDSMDSIITTSHLRIICDFELEFDWLLETDPESPFYNKKFDEIFPSEQRIYTITIENIGNINDSYRISVVDYERHWNVHFMDPDNPQQYNVDPLNLTVELNSSIFNGANSKIQVRLIVPIPDDEPGGDEVTFITIEGVSLFSEEEYSKPHPLMGRVVRKDTMLVKIGDVPKLLLECNEEEKYIVPGEQEKYLVNVINNGNIDFSVRLNHSETSLGWSVEMESAVEVRSGENRFVEVYLTAPGEEYQVKAEAREMVTIEGRVDTHAKGILISSVGIIGVMDHVYRLNASVNPLVNKTSPGEIVEYKVTVKNLGNTNDSITLAPYKVELDWTMTFLEGDEFILGRNEKINITVELTVPEDAQPGSYFNELNISNSNSFVNIILKIETIVNVYDLNIEVYNKNKDAYFSTGTEYAVPGSSASFDLRITNEGSDVDVASLWLYLYEYKEPADDGSINTIKMTKSESDEVMKKSTGIYDTKWYFASVQSSLTA